MKQAIITLEVAKANYDAIMHRVTTESLSESTRKTLYGWLDVWRELMIRLCTDHELEDVEGCPGALRCKHCGAMNPDRFEMGLSAAMPVPVTIIDIE